MTKREKTLIELMLDEGFTPEEWPIDYQFAAQDESCVIYFYSTRPLLQKTFGVYAYRGDYCEFASFCGVNDLAKDYKHTVITKQQFVDAYNEKHGITESKAEWPEESRIDSIGQNGATGEHYPQDNGLFDDALSDEYDLSATGIDAVISERGSRYGRFEDGAAIMQSLKDIARNSPSWSKMKPNQREAMDMIMHKIGRVLNGDPDYADSWIDIQGFAKLVSDYLEGDSK